MKTSREPCPVHQPAPCSASCANNPERRTATPLVDAIRGAWTPERVRAMLGHPDHDYPTLLRADPCRCSYCLDDVLMPPTSTEQEDGR